MARKTQKSEAITLNEMFKKHQFLVEDSLKEAELAELHTRRAQNQRKAAASQEIKIKKEVASVADPDNILVIDWDKVKSLGLLD